MTLAETGADASGEKWFERNGNVSIQINPPSLRSYSEARKLLWDAEEITHADLNHRHGSVILVRIFL